MKTLVRSAGIGLLAVAAGCSDPIGPCDGQHACEVTGIDLAIIDARLLTNGSTGTDDVTGQPIYAAGPVSVEFTVVNRGDSISGPQPVDGGTVLPALRPGQTARFTVTRDYTNSIAVHPSWGGTLNSREADQVRITAYLLQDDHPDSGLPVNDADDSNNARTSPGFHVAMPVLTGTMSEVDELRAGVPETFGFRLENVSVHGADAPAVDVVLCLWDYDLGCYEPWWTYFGRYEVPALDAGSRYENAYVATIDMAAMVDPSMVYDLAQLSLCIVPADHDGPFIDVSGAPDCVASGGTPTVRPNYELCAPPAIAPGTHLLLQTPNCGAGGDRSFHVVALDAVAGATYDLIGPSAVAYDANGAPADLPGAGLSFDADGRYYIVFYTDSPIELSLGAN